jgi:hypothetical protein
LLAALSRKRAKEDSYAAAADYSDASTRFFGFRALPRANTGFRNCPV